MDTYEDLLEGIVDRIVNSGAYPRENLTSAHLRNSMSIYVGNK